MNVISPIFEQIPALYRKDTDKVELHMDKASSHMSKSMVAPFVKKYRNKVYSI